MKKEIDYEKELNDDNFLLKMKSIASQQKQYIDNRKESIVAKINDYKESKKAYYEQNKAKRLEYDKEYRERKKKN
ncbi:hypothetical protein [Aliarcobacter butzleri]|nr:hypothetical protein [Aliarcobacter butzleri]